MARRTQSSVGPHARQRPPAKPPPAPALPITPPRTKLVHFSIPLDKARPAPQSFTATPRGSILDLQRPNRSRSPTTPFEFPFEHVGRSNTTPVNDRPGLVFRIATADRAQRAGPKLMDGGANLCITGDLEALQHVEAITPFPLSTATISPLTTDNDCCTKIGYISLPLSDGTTYSQPCYYCKNATETIISPDAILASSEIFTRWTQDGHRDGKEGTIRFSNADDSDSMTISLTKVEGLYYCTPSGPDQVSSTTLPESRDTTRRAKRYIPVTRERITESEVWMLRLGCPGEDQLDLLPTRVTGTPSSFQLHPFRFIDFKEEARVQKQASQRSAERTTEIKRRFYMDFGFMRATTSLYGAPASSTDRVVLSHDMYSAYLLVIDEASRYAWVFLTDGKSPPVSIVDSFLTRFGHADGGSIRTDQGGELARSSMFTAMITDKFNYTIEPTGSDSPSQNGAVETYNDKLAIRVRTLLYGSGLPAEYWSSALVHSVYLHNRLVHHVTKRTPIEGFFGFIPDIGHLKLFGSRVCVKRSGTRKAKLDRNNYTGIFLGYTATDQNIVYLDLTTGLVKRSHHAMFDEAWYLQPHRPPAAQLLYDLGVEPDDAFYSGHGRLSPLTECDARLPGTVEPVVVPWPPLAKGYSMATRQWKVPDTSRFAPLPLRSSDDPTTFAAKAATTKANADARRLPRKRRILDITKDFGITREVMTMVYMSADPYYDSFGQDIDLRKFNGTTLRTAGLDLYESQGRVHLRRMIPGSPAAKIPDWRTRIKGAWLIKVGDITVSTVQDVEGAFALLLASGTPATTLLFAHPAVRPNLSQDGVPILSAAPFSLGTHDQLNNRWEFSTVAEYLRTAKPNYDIVECGEVQNVVTRAMRLTRGKLLKQPDWSEWQSSEFLQLNQYFDQGMLGQPHMPSREDSIFHLVWTYNIKALDGRKKARCVCDGSPRAGQARILDETYANCVDQTSSRMFYAICAAENLLIYGADVSNAFAEAPPPKQGFYIYPDRAFIEWWETHKHFPPLPAGAVIPVLSAMQGHPESPRLWEKHADLILRDIGLTPTTHEPCLYSGTINDKRVVFMRQVDDFAIGAPDEHTSNILLDMIDEALSIPMKRQGFLDMYNGVDIVQTRDYIKICSSTFIDKITAKYLTTWMTNYNTPALKPTPLPPDPAWHKDLHSAIGDPNPKAQNKLAKQMQLNYRAGVGELIWAMTTTRPDLAYASVKLSQGNNCPSERHYNGVKHALKYLYSTKEDGIYFWRTSQRREFDKGPNPPINSSKQDLLLDNRPDHDATVAHAYADSDWATCPKTRRSFGGSVIRLAGGTIAYKSKFQPTVAGSSTEAEFMAAYDTGKMILFVRSVLWDLGVPQEAATVLYEDNDACTAMGNAQKPTTRTRHIDIKTFSLCEWVERDLMHLERIDTTINMADHLTKGLQRALFHRHADFLLGHVPPRYSPAHRALVGTYQEHIHDTDVLVPNSYTTPLTAKAARTHAPLYRDYCDSPWTIVLSHG